MVGVRRKGKNQAQGEAFQQWREKEDWIVGFMGI